MSVDRILRQSFHSGAFFALQTFSRLLLAVALGKSLSSHEYGTYSLIATVIAMAATLISFSAYQYYFREVPGRTGAEGVGIFKSIVGVQTLFMFGAVALIYGLPFIARSSWHSLGLPEEVGPVLAIGGLLVFDSLATEFSRFLYARKQIEKGNVVMFLQTGLWAFVLFGVFVVRPLSLSLLLVVWFVGVVLAVLYGALHAGPKDLWNAPFRPEVYVNAVRFGAPLMLTYSMVLVDWIGRLIIAGYHSTEVMGVFTYHWNIILMVSAVSAPLISGPIDPYVIEAYNTSQFRRSGELLTAALRYRVIFVIPLVAVIVAWDERLIALMAHADYAQVPGLLALLAPLPILGILGSTFERVLFLERRTATTGRCYVYAAVSQLITFLILVPTHPYVGAAAAANFGLATLVALLWYNARVASMSVSFALGRVAFAALPCLAAAWAVRAWASPSLPPLLGLMLAGAASGTIYLFVAYLFRVFSEAEIRMLAQFVSGGRRRVSSFFVGQTR